MDTSKLKDNILELVCRTCLKINKIRFNLFNHSQNDKLVSDMLMECLSIRIHKDDGLPDNICSNCVNRLSAAYDFKKMAIQSDTKLHILNESKELENNINSIFVKEDTTILKSEENTAIFHLVDHVNLEKTVYDNLLEKPNNNIENNTTNIFPKKESQLQDNVCNSDNTQLSNKNVIHVVALPTNSVNCETPDAAFINNYCENKCIDQTEPMCSENFKEEDASSTNESNDFLDDCNSLPACISEEPKDKQDEIKRNQSKVLNTSDTTFTEINEYCDEPEKVTDSSESMKRNNKFTEYMKQYYMKHYEKQVELLDNPDCQKIISMGLSKKEKNQAKVLCRECGKTLTFRYYVSVHVHTHIGNKPFKCDICGRSFVREYILKQHMHVHADTKKFSCDVCGKPCRTLQAMESHKRTHSDERSFQCDACDKSFKYNESLKQHLLTHKQDKDFMCELCGKSFKDNSGLIAHSLSHNTERTFMCTTCGKGFTSQTRLNYHMRRHSDIRPYVCSYCGARFRSNNVLKNHVLIHTGAKPFSCKICSKDFRQRPSLRYHMRIHTGETPYECDLCSSKFKYKHHLSNHMKVHRNESSQK